MKAIITIERTVESYYYATIQVGDIHAQIVEDRIWHCDVVDSIRPMKKLLEILGYEVELIDKPHEDYTRKRSECK